MFSVHSNAFLVEKLGIQIQAVFPLNCVKGYTDFLEFIDVFQLSETAEFKKLAHVKTSSFRVLKRQD